MLGGKGGTMSITPEAYQDIAVELQHIKDYLLALAQKIQDEAPPGYKRGHAWAASLDAEHAIAHLHQILTTEQDC
jgi:hypothetical protein